jgi:hypothetical protein
LKWPLNGRAGDPLEMPYQTEYRNVWQVHWCYSQHLKLLRDSIDELPSLQTYYKKCHNNMFKLYRQFE